MADTEQKTAWTVGRLLDWTTAHFQQKSVEGGRLAAELLLARALNCKKIDLYTRYNLEPTEEQRTQFRDLVRRAGEHVPIAYLLGTREFFSLEFTVSPAVLIPRPETEALVQRAIDFCRQRQDQTQHILDIGTGSGCIAIAIARYAPNAQIVAVDISSEALSVAQANWVRHELGDRVRLVQADVAALPSDAIPAAGFDLIVSNPPYISEPQWSELPPNVREHEPRTALYGGVDGLDFYRQFATELPARCSTGAILLVEIGYQQQDAVRKIFCDSPNWQYIGSHRDRTDPHERVLEFQRSVTNPSA